MLQGLPTIRVITLKESIERQNNFIRQFKDIDYEFIKFDRYSPDKIKLIGSEILHPNSLGTISSHLWNMHKWYYTSRDPYMIVMEDDVSLITTKYWGFTLKEYIESLPSTWEAVQLTWIGYKPSERLGLRRREPDDFGLACYIVKREYVKKVLDMHYRKEWVSDLNMPDRPGQLPIVENIVLNSANPNVLISPLFVEDIENTKTTYVGTELLTIDGQGIGHKESYYQVLNWWKSRAGEI